jgi:hypothetical protein
VVEGTPVRLRDPLGHRTGVLPVARRERVPRDPRLVLSNAAHTRCKLAALRETLVGVGWTHRVDHSFQAHHAVTNCARARLVYLRALCAAPQGYCPAQAWIVPEPHPTNPGRYHVHGLWRMAAVDLWRGWWHDAKEWWGAGFGWTRIFALPHRDKAALGKAVTYAAKHHVKAHPLTWHRYATRYERDSSGGYTMAYWSRGGKRMVLHVDQGGKPCADRA